MKRFIALEMGFQIVIFNYVSVFFASHNVLIPAGDIIDIEKSIEVSILDRVCIN